MSTLTVQNIQGSASSSNTISVASGHVLNAPGHILQIVHAGNNTTLASNATDTWFKYLEATITPSL